MNQGTIVVPDRIPQPGTLAFRNFLVGATVGLSKEAVQEVARYFRRAYRRLTRTPSTRRYPRQGTSRRGNLQPKKLDFTEEIVEKSLPAFSFGSEMGDQVQFRRMKFTVGRTHRRSANEVFKKQVGSMDEHICRWSRVSPNLLGPGRLTLTYGKDSTAPVDNKPSVRMPLHIMSLTHFPNGNHNTAVGAKPQGMAAIVYRGDGGTTTVAAGSFGHQLIQNESPAGAVKEDGSWEFELGGDFPVNFENVFHKWTEVRLNLYGATLVPLTYTVTVLTGMPEEMQLFEYEPVSASGSASANLTSFPIVRQSPLNEFFRERLHRYLGNPIVGNSDTKTVSGKYRILFEKKITVAPLSYGDAAAEATSVINSTNIKNVNLFIRHDRDRDYTWHIDPTTIKYQNELGDNSYNVIQTTRNLRGLSEVDRPERVFLMLQCSATGITDSDQFRVVSPYIPVNTPPAQAYTTQGSYDIVVRNCFRAQSHTFVV